jgi:hypothetical protein
MDELAQRRQKEKGKEGKKYPERSERRRKAHGRKLSSVGG